MLQSENPCGHQGTSHWGSRDARSSLALKFARGHHSHRGVPGCLGTGRGLAASLEPVPSAADMPQGFGEHADVPWGGWEDHCCQLSCAEPWCGAAWGALEGAELPEAVKCGRKQQ